MTDTLEWSRYAPEPDLDAMDHSELLDYLQTVRSWIGKLDEQEPEEMGSEEYEAWGDRHEALEDLADEIQEHLDEMENAHDGFPIL